MKLQPIKAEYMKVLQRIQDSIPKEWLDNLGHEEVIAPTIKKMYEKVAKTKVADLAKDLAKGDEKSTVKDWETRAKEVKRKAKIILDSGELDKKTLVIDKNIEKKIDKFVDEEIEAAIRRGELPKGKKFRNLNKKLKKQIKQPK